MAWSVGVLVPAVNDSQQAPLGSVVIKAERKVEMTNTTENWTTQKPTQTGWYWYRKDSTDIPILFYCGALWDHLADFAGLTEPVAFMKDHLLEGEWAGPLVPPE